MAREINNNEFDSSNGRNEGMNDRERLEGLAASEMADRGPKGMSSFTGEEDGTETRPVSHMYAEPGGKSGALDDDDMDDDDDDLDIDDDDDLDIDEDIEVEDDDAVEIDDTITDDDLEDDDLVLDEDEDEEDDL